MTFCASLTGFELNLLKPRTLELLARYRLDLLEGPQQLLDGIELLGDRALVVRYEDLVGDPIAAEALVQDIADVQVEIVEAGHLMGGEIPEECNQLILDFFIAE